MITGLPVVRLDVIAGYFVLFWQEEDPWIELRLERTVYIHEIILITKNAIPAIVKTSRNKNTGQTSSCRVAMDTGHKQTAKCSMEFKADLIRVGLPKGVKRSLSLCWMQAAAFGNRPL